MPAVHARRPWLASAYIAFGPREREMTREMPAPLMSHMSCPGRHMVGRLDDMREELEVKKAATVKAAEAAAEAQATLDAQQLVATEAEKAQEEAEAIAQEADDACAHLLSLHVTSRAAFP